MSAPHSTRLGLLAPWFGSAAGARSAADAIAFIVCLVIADRTGVRFEIRLQRPSQLFVADDVLPTSAFYSEYTVRPAMECIRDRIWEAPRQEGVEVMLLLPASEIRPGLGEELTVAARRWWEVLETTRRIDSQKISVVRRQMTVMVFVLYAVMMAAGLIALGVNGGTQGSWLETVGQALVITANILVWYPLKMSVAGAMERRALARRAAWLRDVSIEVKADGAPPIGRGLAVIGVAAGATMSTH
jgi:hypothetical protein